MSAKGRHPFDWQQGYKEGCVFCEIVREDPHGQIVWANKSKSSFAFIPRDPVIPGHHLVVPLNHVIDAVHLSNTLAHNMHAAYEFGRNVLKFEDFDMSVNVGADAGQTVFHLHIHVYPRHAGDNLPQPGWKPECTFEPWLVKDSLTGCPITAVNNLAASGTNSTWVGRDSVAIVPLGTLATDHWLLAPKVERVCQGPDDPVAVGAVDVRYGRADLRQGSLAVQHRYQRPAGLDRVERSG